ncbi:glutamine amidotransferase [Haladaptatus sp. R4]|uniref:glutamine amidotransferase n=1 Tax=Haladaptatus sp. R4 TaxID=1679489 RepID=UPI000A6A2C05|nr:glutamine amidotransferase [Haladaptatus sp. R4]
MTNVLLAGESWTTVQFEIKGRNVMHDSEYGESADEFIETLESVGASVTYQPCHVAAKSFPRTAEELDEYDLVH